MSEEKGTKRQLEEIEIDLAQTAPLSKKQKRLLRKGKLDLTKLEKEQKEEAERLTKNAQEGETSDKGEDDDENKDSKPKIMEKKKQEPRFGVWIGNMTFDTVKEDLIRFITTKTSEFPEFEKDVKEDQPCKVAEGDIARINLPNQSDSKKIKGFAYVDFNHKQHQQAVIKCSEQPLNGRKLLIKDSKSYEGRPTKEDVEMSKNPPSRILFVGNLSFDTTQDMLTDQFQHCGEIIKIRMATFQDTGKCKGFAFIDFRDEEGATKALKDKSCRRLMNRNLRMEFGEDRSKRAPRATGRDRPEGEESQDDNHGHSHSERLQEETFVKPIEHTERPIRERKIRPVERKPVIRKKERQISSVALASAQRASAAVVKSTGKKTTF